MSYKLQKSFSAGEVSPKLYLRNDGDLSQAIQQGLSISRNIIPTPHGPAESREGFRYVEELEGEIICRLFDLDISFGESYTIAVTPNFIYVIDRNGFKKGANIVLNPNFSSGGDDWNEDQTVFAAGTAILSPTPGLDARISQQLTTPDAEAEHTVEIFGFGADGANPFTINIGTTEEGSEIDSIPGNGINFSAVFTPGLGNDTFWLTVNVEADGLNKVIDAISVFPTGSAGEVVTFPSPYSATDLPGIQVDKEPGNKVMFFVHRNVPPKELIFEGTNIWDFQDVLFVFGEGNDAPWGEEFPGCITFYAGRMALGGTYGDPIGIWLSEPRIYRGFDLGDASAPDDALYLPLDKHGELVWLKGGKQLFAGLDSGEHIVFGEGGIVTGSNAATEQHSTYGSSRIQAQVVNEDVAYVDTRGRKVRLIDFDSNEQNMQSFDVSFIAEHITEGRISEMKYGSSPYGVLYMPTFFGDMVNCYIEKDRGTYGWSRFDTQGIIISSTVLREFGVDVLWIAVIREGKLFIERGDVLTDVFSDSHLTVDETGFPTNVFFGFDHLIGFTVQVVADGAVHPDVVVQPDGSVILQTAAQIITVGLGFLAEIQSIPENNDTEEGNTRSHIKRYSKVNVSILDSPRPIINGQDTYRRSPSTPMNEREQANTEIVEITNVGWSNDSIINVQQPLPLKMVISGIGGKIKSNKL